MGSNYLTVEGSSTTSSGSSDSLNGLKFGQKIYFEDVGLGVSAKASGGSGGSSGREVAAMTPKKGRGGAAQCGQPPRCQVEGCNLDLSDSKLYYSRHKVCVMHSKSPKVIVAGIEQRFCQQCSRFHQLPEFDQGKRSCRRRLAGHNERRRKPPAGSSLSSRFGRLSPSIFDSSSRSSEFIVDFSAYARASPRSLWPATKSYDPRQLGVQPASTGKCLQNTWAGSLGDPMPDMYMQGSPSVGGFYITSGESITGVSSDSTCALSLLSNQPWLSRNRADTTMEGSPIAQLPTATSPFAVGHFPHGSSSWGFKGTEPTGGGLHDAPPELGLGQISYPLGGGGQFDGSFEVGHHNGRQYMEVEHSRVYMSTEHDVGWSL